MIRKAFALLLLCTTVSMGVRAEGKITTAEIKTKINCDHCSKCESCSARLEKALYELKGIKRVDIDDKMMTIKVAYNKEKASIGDIRNTIAASGYDADDVKAPAEALAGLDACCRVAE